MFARKICTSLVAAGLIAVPVGRAQANDAAALVGGLLLAWFGGPLWKVNPMLGGFELADERDNSRMIVAGTAVALLFGALALFLK